MKYAVFHLISLVYTSTIGWWIFAPDFGKLRSTEGSVASIAKGILEETNWNGKEETETG